VQQPVERQHNLDWQQVIGALVDQPADLDGKRAAIAGCKDRHRRPVPDVARHEPDDAFHAKPQQQRRDEQGVQQRSEDHAAHQHLEAEEAAPAGLAQELARRAVVDDEGLHPAFHPARALRHPGPHGERRFLERAAGDHFGTQAATRQPDAQIGILRHVERVPAADFAQDLRPEVVAGAAQRYRQPPARQGWEQPPEQPRIFAGKQCRQRVLAGIFRHQLRLQAGDAWISGEPARGESQLAGVGHVLGIVDDEIRATRQRQRVVDGFGFGAWWPIRHEHHAEHRVGEHLPYREHRCLAPLFDDEFHVELFGRIVQCPHRARQHRHHRGFVAQWDEYGVDRQLDVAQQLGAGRRRAA